MFRVAVKQVNPRIDFDTGKTFTEVTLEVHWEPRFPVFRIDSQPTITALGDDAGSKPTVVAARAKTPPTGFTHTTTIRIEGVPREAKQTDPAGTSPSPPARRCCRSYSRTWRARSPWSASPAAAQDSKVTAVLKRFEKANELWEAEVEVTYPSAGPEFESFESWVTENRAGWSPRTSRPRRPTVSTGRPAGGCPACTGSACSRDPEGVVAGVRTPAPLVEFPVRFDLTDIPLP